VSPGSDLSVRILTAQDVYLAIAEQREGLGQAYEAQAAAVSLSPADMKAHDIAHRGNVEIGNDCGSIVVQARPDPGCPQGWGRMAASLYSMRLAAYDPAASLLPNTRVIEAVVRLTDQEVTPVSRLLAGSQDG